MTTVKTLLGQCIILLVIFVCNVQPWDEKSGDINCEYFPFYAACRGSMSKRKPANDANVKTVDINSAPLENRLWMSLLNILDDDDYMYSAEYDSNTNNGNGLSEAQKKLLKERFIESINKLQKGFQI